MAENNKKKSALPFVLILGGAAALLLLLKNKKTETPQAEPFVGCDGLLTVKILNPKNVHLTIERADGTILINDIFNGIIPYQINIGKLFGPGDYAVTAGASGFKPQVIPFTLTPDVADPTKCNAVQVEFILMP